jgi:tetratricopeptide (TPR) repeat protein
MLQKMQNIKIFQTNKKIAKLLFCGVAVSFVSLFTVIPDSYAQTSSEQISALIAASQVDQALALIQKELISKPKDPTLVFQRGISLAVLGKHDEAMADFLFLTQEYPTLPEPYHNLAIIYSHKGDFARAKSALDTAIQNNPNYASAYDNLGDVYTKLAAQSYQKAQQLDANNLSAKSKNDLLSVITSVPIGSKQVYNASSANQNSTNIAQVNTANVNAVPENANNMMPAQNTTTSSNKNNFKDKDKEANKITKADTKKHNENNDIKVTKKNIEKEKIAEKITDKASTNTSSNKNKVSKKDNDATSVVENSAPVSSLAPKTKLTVNEQQPAADTSNNPNDQENIKKSLQNWSSAWSSKNTNGYLSAYSPSFKPIDGTEKATWEAKRKARINEKGEINVSVQEPQINIKGNKATVVFKQVYKSDKLRDINQKTLEMVKVNGEWKIEKEKSF